MVSEVDEFWRDLPSAMHCEITIGGATRADSVRAGLDKLALDDHELVLVHDSVRPLFSSDDVSELIRVAGSSESGALLATPVVDTLKYSDDGTSVTGTKDREQYWLAQTPQAFAAGLLKRALQQSDGGVITDEASAIEAMGLHPVLVPASKDNIKITTSEDLALAEFLLQKESRQ